MKENGLKEKEKADRRRKDGGSGSRLMQMIGWRLMVELGASC